IKPLFSGIKTKGLRIFLVTMPPRLHREMNICLTRDDLASNEQTYGQLSMEQVPFNRFTEFVTATFSNMGKEKSTVTKVSVADVLSSCIEQFGFSAQPHHT
ncbi:hypothetical protein BCU21_019870, partial [Vibrio breoganii]